MPVHASNIGAPGSVLNLTLSGRSLNSSGLANMTSYNISSSGSSNMTVHCNTLNHSMHHFSGSIASRSILAGRNEADEGSTLGAGSVFGILLGVVAFAVAMFFMIKWARGSHQSAFANAQARHQQGGWVRQGTMRAGGGKRGYGEFGADYASRAGPAPMMAQGEGHHSRYEGRLPKQAGSGRISGSRGGRTGPQFPGSMHGTNFASIRAAQQASRGHSPGPYGQDQGSQSNYV